MKRLIALAGCAVFLAGASLYADEEVVGTYSADAYATCAACHLADGAGIPAAFPPINNRVAIMAGLPGGREYLITVLSSGLMGTIEAGGAQFFGVMPGNKGMMSAEEMAAALNYAIFELVDDKTSVAEVEPITADEVSAILSSDAEGSPATTAELRNGLIERNGEEWPR